MTSPTGVSPEFLLNILQPYRPHSRFLREAVISYPVAGGDANHVVRGKGRFSVPGPWYIDDTGHFNAVDSVICFNQLGYVTFATALIDGRIRERTLPDSREAFKARMLPDMLITKIASKFVRPMKSQDFTGTFDIVKLRVRGHMVLMQATAMFCDADGGLAELKALLAVTSVG